jgi:hypothetical protein
MEAEHGRGADDMGAYGTINKYPPNLEESTHIVVIVLNGERTANEEKTCSTLYVVWAT